MMFDMLVNLYDESLLDARIQESIPGQDGYSVIRTPGILADELASFAEQEFSPMWASETRRSLYSTPSDSYAVVYDNHIVGFCAFNATAKGFFGPTGVHHDHRGKGLGRILLVNALLSLRQEGYAYAVIGGVNEAAGFYERTVHATRIPSSDKHSIYAHMGISF